MTEEEGLKIMAEQILKSKKHITDLYGTAAWQSKELVRLKRTQIVLIVVVAVSCLSLITIFAALVVP
jgi:hypothetical protein